MQGIVMEGGIRTKNKNRNKHLKHIRLPYWVNSCIYFEVEIEPNYRIPLQRDKTNLLLRLHCCHRHDSTTYCIHHRAMLRLGSSRPWPDAMEIITGQRDIDVGPLLEYFKPLSDWLEEQNAGHDVTWDDDCPPMSAAGSAVWPPATTARMALLTTAVLLAWIARMT